MINYSSITKYFAVLLTSCIYANEALKTKKTSYVFDLDAENFDLHVIQSTDPWLVEFYRDDCLHC